MKQNMKRMILSVAGILFSASNALAVSSTAMMDANGSSTDIVSNLGYFLTVGGLILNLTKYGSIFICVIALFQLWATGNIAKAQHKAEEYVRSQDGMKKMVS